MRVWHNIGAGLDAVEYIPGKMYGVIGYKVGYEFVESNRIWYASRMDHEELMKFIDWCDLVCDKEIYNRITKKDEDNDWN